MDAKALAKSKRAHSLHHSKKHHPNTTSKAPLVGPVGGTTSSAKKPSGKQVKEKPHQSHGSSALPSNWDRYEEEYDSGSELSSQDKASQTTDIVVPKSKGADYVHLISEAKSQSSTDIFSDSFPSFDDVLTGYNQGVGSLLSVRGQGILSWAGDDNFVVEDKATASHEASFLSLNLHLLAEQLAKVDLSQRLFIEPDLLTPDLYTEESKTSFSQESDPARAACQIEVAEQNSDEADVNGYHERDTVGNKSSELLTSPFNHALKSANQFQDENTMQCTEQINRTTTAENPKEKSSKLSRFEATAAEAELDMLLDSFIETKFVHLSKPASVAACFDNTLDDLLEETSSKVTFSVQQEETSTSSLGGILSLQSAPTRPSMKGPDLPKSASNFDHYLDDLLEDASNFVNQKAPALNHEIKTAQPSTMSSSSGPVSKSKVSDDFDSWFDTI